MRKSLRKLLSLMLVLAMIISLLPLGSTDSLAATGKKIIAYFPNWGTYNPAHKSMTVGMIPWDKITVINHAFFEVDSSFKLLSTDPFADFDKAFDHSGGWNPGDLKGHIGEYKYYKGVYPNVKVMISVGGWTRGQNFHAMALSSSTRATFIQSIVDFLKQYPFIDGIDLDWEYPGINRAPDPNDPYDRGCPGGPEDKQNFTALLREIRAAYNSNGLSDKLLTIAAPAGYDKLELQEPNIYAQYLDWLNVMTYDIHGAWETTTNHHAAIYANPNDPSPTAPTDIKNKYNTDYAMRNLRDTYNIPASKLNVGSPFYSRGWKSVTGGTNGMYANASGAPVGTWDSPTSPGGQYPYSALKSMENVNGYVKYRDTSYAMTPWLYNSSLGITLSYEDDISLNSRCDYINSNGFGGLTIWEISGDDANFSLTNIAYNKLIGQNPIQTVATPILSPASGSFQNAQNVAISCATADANIRYTLDGTEPTAASTQYSGAINIASTTTVKAKAFKSGMNDSATASATYTIGTPIDTVAAPTFSPAAGTYTNAQNVTLSCATASATIRYTLDGSEPTTNSSQYTGAINIASTTTVKAKAFKSGMNNSATTSATYTIENGQAGTDSGTPNGAPPTAALSTNNYDGNASYTVTFNIWWGNNATSYKVYENNNVVLSGPLNANSPNGQTATYNFSNKTNGTYLYKMDLTNSFGTTVSNTISINVTKGGTTPVETVVAPTFSPAAGTYSAAQNVTLSCATADATIRYTLDGSEPTATSSQYNGAINVASTTTVKAKAFKSGMNNSSTASATYTISNPIQTVSTPTFSPGAGTYSVAQNVTLSCSTADATIRYTVNGSEPTSSSTVYSSPITVAATKTVKAKAFKSGMTASNTASATYTISSNPITELPTHVLTGYWQNFTNGATNLRISDVPTTYDIIAVAFADATSVPGQVSFTLDSTLASALGGYTQAQFISDIAAAKARGQKVIISVGGQNGTISVADSASATNFANSIYSLMNTYGFDGVDIDLENGVNPTYMASALRQLSSLAGSNLIITMAPETLYMQSTGSSYFSLALSIQDILTIVNTQYYNSGPMLGYNGQVYSQGTEDFMTALATILLENGLRPDQVGLGLPASTSAAGGGYVSPSVVNNALDCLANGTNAGSYIPPNTYPSIRGAMTWSINWDASNNYNFASTVKPHLNSLGGDISTVTTPTFSPAGGTYSAAQNVTLSTATVGATIRYTLDGSEPTATSTQYTVAINVASNTTVKAKAFKSGMNDSATVSATYTISNPIEIVVVPTFSPAAGTYSEAQNVTLSCATNGATIWYTTDGSTPSSSSAAYMGAINVPSTTTIKAIATKSGMNNSSIASATYTISTGDYPAWSANTTYMTGDIVSYNGSNYRCVQGHTSLTGWEPPIVPALWELQ